MNTNVWTVIAMTEENGEASATCIGLVTDFGSAKQLVAQVASNELYRNVSAAGHDKLFKTVKEQLAAFPNSRLSQANVVLRYNFDSKITYTIQSMSAPKRLDYTM